MSVRRRLLGACAFPSKEHSHCLSPIAAPSPYPLNEQRILANKQSVDRSDSASWSASAALIAQMSLSADSSDSDLSRRTFETSVAEEGLAPQSSRRTTLLQVARRTQAYWTSFSSSNKAVSPPEPQRTASSSAPVLQLSNLSTDSQLDSVCSKSSRHTAIFVPPHLSFREQDLQSNSDQKSQQERLKRLTLSQSAETDTGVSSRARHVEIKIPDWAQPIFWNLESPKLGPPDKSVSIDSRRELVEGRPPNMASNHIVSPITPSGSTTALGNTAHGSQTSLVGSRSDYESASEAELSQSEEPDQNASRRTQHAEQASGNDSSDTAPQQSSNLSGLVCNVHRTTGREPHPLVGATTTILGDKLYVFGGRRLSRSKPLLTSNIYELDLVHRHWTKLEPGGDIPPPRYFHSVCTLGDTKLVCYGGMSPLPTPDRTSAEQSEVVVMSDIHIYDVTLNSWTKVFASDAPQGRYAHCAAILPSGAYFSSQKAPLSAMQHNASGDKPNQGTLGVSIDGTGGAEMVVVGGQDSTNTYIEQISIFNFRSLKWTGTTGMGRSCGAYRSVVAPLTTMKAEHIGVGPHAGDDGDEDDEDEPMTHASSCSMLIYSNYNFMDVKLELQIRLTDGTLTEKAMRPEISPPGLRFPNGGVIDNHFVVSGTFLTSSKQEYALWALDLRTLTWSRIDASSNIFGQGSWNRGVLWTRRNAFVILGNRRRNLVDDYNNRRINFTNICLVELEAFGLYDNPRIIEPSSAYVSASANQGETTSDLAVSGRQISEAAASLGALSLGVRELADMDFLAIDGTRIPVSSRLVARRWGPYFTQLMQESHTSNDGDTATLRPSVASHTSRNSSITITSSLNSGSTLTNNAGSEVPDARSMPPPARSRLLYLPHTAPTLQALLHYLYTSSLPAPPSNLATPQIFCSLLQIARPYRIDGLLEAVVRRLHESLDGRNAAAIFNAAAMGAGGGDGVHFTSRAGDGIVPPRKASLAQHDVGGTNGVAHGLASLRVDTDTVNGRAAARPGTALADGNDNDTPLSAVTDASLSESEASLGDRRTRGTLDREEWNGALSAVVGLQKRGLRGLMEGRRIRERGRSEGADGARVGLGIASA